MLSTIVLYGSTRASAKDDGYLMLKALVCRPRLNLLLEVGFNVGLFTVFPLDGCDCDCDCGRIDVIYSCYLEFLRL